MPNKTDHYNNRGPIDKGFIQPKHIAIAGNIGAGKTTLASKLAQHFDWEVMYEAVDDNPYLEDFYKDMRRWSFNLQIYFLNSRLEQLKEISENPKTVIQDRTIYEDAHIFAPNLYEMKLMSQRDFENYVGIFRTMSGTFRPPDLLIYLQADIPSLVERIGRRGRNYETNIRFDYLQRLNKYYENWIRNYDKGKLLIIDVKKYNFADKPEDLGEVIQRISTTLGGGLFGNEQMF